MTIVRRPPQDRFFEKVRDDGDCWMWTGASRAAGYGLFNTGPSDVGPSKLVYAHRWAYEHMIHEIPDGLTIDHLCRNEGCVNPFHMEPVPLAVNLQRAESANAKKTHCPQGHEYCGVNTYINRRGSRVCVTCRNESVRRCEAKSK